MITHSTSTISRVRHEEKNNLDVRTTPRLTKEDNAVISARRVLKWFGAISTVLLSTVALVPGPFRIPANLQPWMFLIAIFWVLAFCAGMFDL
jgi:hypothetical protein